MTIRTNSSKFQKLAPRPSTPPKPAHTNTQANLRLDTFKAVLPPVKKVVEFALEKLLPKTLGDKRTSGDAVREADELLRGPAVDRDSEGTAQTIRDAANVNDSRDTDVESTRHKAALEQLKANEALEAAALKRLSPTEQQQYQAVKQRCLDANDPVAALALEKLLLDGKLPGEKDLKGEGTTLDHSRSWPTRRRRSPRASTATSSSLTSCRSSPRPAPSTRAIVAPARRPPLPSSSR
ncbi:MAG: hypothetical protein JNJ54_10385 [Myxococcaceae bacterium]|nr:hypothetical protein [Myxococcaceae bacterium]